MRRRSTRIIIASFAATVAVGSALAWTAFGPGLTKACPVPALRPIGPEWIVVGSNVGGLNGPGDVWGSQVTWERAAAAAAPRRRLEVVLSQSLDGEWGHASTARGRPARVATSEWPEPGSIAVWWDGGGLGCTIYGVTLSGEGVTEAETAAVVEALR